MLDVFEEDLVKARVDRCLDEYPRFEDYWRLVTDWLARDPLIGETDGKRLNDSEPPLYAVDLAAWRPGGIPPTSLVYEQSDVRITIKAIAIHVPKARR